jgi:hypothetical protein
MDIHNALWIFIMHYEASIIYYEKPIFVHNVYNLTITLKNYVQIIGKLWTLWTLYGHIMKTYIICP